VGYRWFNQLWLLQPATSIEFEIPPSPPDAFIEVNAQAPVAPERVDTRFISFQDQQAAGQAVDAQSEAQQGQQLEGETWATKITSSVGADQAEHLADAGSTAVDTLAIPDGDESFPEPLSRPKAQIKGISGPLKKSQALAPRLGLQAVDARFTQWGGYLQELFEIISAQWYMLVRQSYKLSPPSGTYIQMGFDLSAQGQILKVELLQTNAQQHDILLVQDAVLSPAPYRPWTTDMVDTLGSVQRINMKFIYR